ncbi:MAG TPA: AraC family transcriptional regulator [Usitatibacter sp.]|nr:AraC family transcriptional regulator [Usitatibacter sp.]
MDALSEVLRLARFSADVVLDGHGRGPWCVSVPASGSVARAHLVLEGECALRAAGGVEARLPAGTLAFLAHGDAHLLATSNDADAVPFSALLRSPVAGELVPVSLGKGGAPTRWISIAVSCERHFADPLLAALPATMVCDLLGAPALNWLTGALGLHLSASDAPAVGEGAKRERLAELVLLEALRRHVHAVPPGRNGWLAGLNDRYVGRTLALVHARPSEPWTVERLGRQVGLSRSALAERFSAVMGEPIIAFLTRWRLQLAAESLLATPRSVESIAREAGYESASAFSHAFRRAFRKPPSVWRKKKGSDPFSMLQRAERSGKRKGI